MVELGAEIIGGPYSTMRIAIGRARADLLYPALLRQCLERGVLTAKTGHTKVSIPMLATWTGYSRHVIYAWLRPHTQASYRPMSRSAIRLVIHEFRLRDQSKYAWSTLLKMTS